MLKRLGPGMLLEGAEIASFPPPRLCEEKKLRCFSTWATGCTASRGSRVIPTSPLVQERKPRCFSTWITEDQRVKEGDAIVIRSALNDRVWLCLYTTRWAE